MANAVSGLVSGIDTTSIVQSLVDASAKTKTILQDQQDAIDSRAAAYGTLRARLTTLQTSLDDIATARGFRSVTARSGSEENVGVSVNGDAVIGRFSVKVNQLASASMDVSSGFTSRDTSGVMATGTLNLTVGSTTTGVTIESGDSLEEIVTKINDNVSGVMAYVMETGDATAPYRLVISGQETGAENGVSIDTSGLDAATGTVPTFTQANAARDAEVEINGIVVTDSDNDIDAAIEGVTFHAYETMSTATNVTVAHDDDAMVEKIEGLVTAWNAVVSHIRAQRSWNPDENIKGAFVGESQPRSVLFALQSSFADSYGTGDIRGLGQIGLSTTKDGDLELDTDTLQAALSTDFDGVVSLVTGEGGVAQTLSDTIDGMVDEDDGSLSARIDSLEEQSETMAQRIADFQDRLDAYQARLEKQFVAMELAMARFQNAGSQLLALLPDSSSSSSKK